MDLPSEIQKIILNYCDDKTRRIARLACVKWFNIIDYRNFTLYLTRKSDWPLIVDRLSSYSKPISLWFRKNIMKKLGDFNEYLLQLTNLTDLSFDGLDRSEEDICYQWLKLTALPNLNSVEVHSTDYNIPFEALLQLSHLTKFVPANSDEDDNSMIFQQAIQRLTKLQSCSISQYPHFNLDEWDRPITTLTQLSLYLPNIAEKWFANTGNIKDLYVSADRSQQLSLKMLTALEEICANLDIQLHEYNSTRLTYLVTVSHEHYIIHELYNLTQLKRLHVDLDPHNSYNEIDRQYSYQWLTALTALEALYIQPLTDEGLSYVWTTLTHLSIDVSSKQANLSHLKRFASMKKFSIGGFNLDLALLAQLTTLESLSISQRGQPYNGTCFLSLLTNLTHLYLYNCSAGEIPYLPNLETLDIHSESCQFSGVEGLPKLTNLQVRTSNSGSDFDYTVVTNIATLQYLELTSNSVQYDCRYFSTLVELQYLSINAVTSEDDYCYLSTLNKLTELRIAHGPCSAKILHLPTSVQRLKVNLSQSAKHYPSLTTSECDTASIIKRLQERLPNLYEYSF